MKLIKLVSPILLAAPYDFYESANENANIYKENAKIIIFICSHLENVLTRCISKYFFGRNESDYPKITEFEDVILSTDFFTFSAKRKTFLYILKKQKIRESNSFNDIEKLLSKVIKYRNLFTHGSPVFHNDMTVVHYFESTKKEQLIDDTFLTEVELTLKNAFKLLEDIIGEIKSIWD